MCCGVLLLGCVQSRNPLKHLRLMVVQLGSSPELSGQGAGCCPEQLPPASLEVLGVHRWVARSRDIRALMHAGR